MPGEEKRAAPKYEAASSERLGRYLIASKDLSAGEVILREKPLVVGPTAFGKDYLCFSCLRLLLKVNKAVHYVCTKCRVAPLCSAACEERVGYHTPDECEIFQSNENLSPKNIPEIIRLLLPLRLWLLKKRDPTLWGKVESMEAHVEKRRNTVIWHERDVNVVQAIRTLKLIPEKNIDVGEFLQQLCGILDVNVFELRSPGGLDDGDLLPVRGLYDEATLMAHDCRGNTHLTADDDFELTVYASLPIKAGQPILFNYTSSLLGTAERREHLREGKYFECGCSLCEDPYEMQSHLSTILCPRCKKGLVGMQNPLITNPYGYHARWQCERCGKCYGGGLVKTTLDITQKLIDEVDDSDVKKMEALVKKLSTSFHPHHFLLLTLKRKLMAAYRREMSAQNPSKKIIRNMLELCREMLGVLEIVEPGISRTKGIMLYEMHLPLVLLANCDYAAREISSTELASRLEEAQKLLKRALTMLLLEPVSTPEGKLAKRALQELKVLNSYIAEVRLPEIVVERRGAKEHRKKNT